MGFTLAEARTRLRADFLDDPDSDRWTDAELDRHLKMARSRVLNAFIRKGSQVFRSSLTQAAVAGQVDLSAVLPSKIVRVTKNNGTYSQVVRYEARRNVSNLYQGGENFTIWYDQVPDFPATDGAAFIDSANTFDELEDLCIVRAFQTAVMKDSEVPQGVVGYLKHLEKDVFANGGVKRVERFPRPAGPSGLAWSYDYSTNLVVLSYADAA